MYIERRPVTARDLAREWAGIGSFFSTKWYNCQHLIQGVDEPPLLSSLMVMRIYIYPYPRGLGTPHPLHPARLECPFSTPQP